MQRYFAKEKNDNEFILETSDIYHIKTVMRMSNNDEIQIVYNKEAYLCYINNIENDIKIIIKSKLDKIISDIPKVTLIIPVLKEQKMDLILQKATELGVYKIIPVITERSIVKTDGKENKKLERWNKICKEASEQSYRLEIPIIAEIQKLSDLNDIDGVKLVCSTIEKNTNFKKMMKKESSCDRIIVVVGPEGGLSSKEEEILNNKGFQSVTLGNRILRVETVPIFVLSVINYEFME